MSDADFGIGNLSFHQKSKIHPKVLLLNVIQRLVPFVDKTIDFQADSLMLELIVD
jgi:hypothetical protein